MRKLDKHPEKDEFNPPAQYVDAQDHSFIKQKASGGNAEQHILPWTILVEKHCFSLLQC